MFALTQSRRSFLKLTGAAAAALVLDPERLLWVPGAKTFFLPSQQITTAATMDDALRAGLVAMVPNGHGGYARVEIALTGAGHSLAERVSRERAAVLRMGGWVVPNTQYVQHTIPTGTIRVDGRRVAE